jgi:transposase
MRTTILISENLWDKKGPKTTPKKPKSTEITRLEPVIKVGRMVKNYMWGIINAIMFKTTNAVAESKNARIQRIKKMACGFRNRKRFRMAILFHLGKLDLMPETLGNYA